MDCFYLFPKTDVASRGRSWSDRCCHQPERTERNISGLCDITKCWFQFLEVLWVTDYCWKCLHMTGPLNVSTSICLSPRLCICVHYPPSSPTPSIHTSSLPCPTFTIIIISAGRLLPPDSVFNVSCALISTQTLLQANVQRWGERKFDRRWKGRHGKKDKLAKPEKDWY